MLLFLIKTQKYIVILLQASNPSLHKKKILVNVQKATHYKEKVKMEFFAQRWTKALLTICIHNHSVDT